MGAISHERPAICYPLLRNPGEQPAILRGGIRVAALKPQPHAERFRQGERFAGVKAIWFKPPQRMGRMVQADNGTSFTNCSFILLP